MFNDLASSETRRYFLQQCGIGLGAVALASLLHADAPAQETGGIAGLPHFAAKSIRVIYLLQSGAPSQLDLFVDKPRLRPMFGADLREITEHLPPAPRTVARRHAEKYRRAIGHCSKFIDDRYGDGLAPPPAFES